MGPATREPLACAGMEDLLARLGDVSLDPIASPAGIAIALLGVVLLARVARLVFRVALLAVIVIGLYLAFYAG